MGAHDLFQEYDRIDKILHGPVIPRYEVLVALLSLYKKHPDDPLGLSDIIPHVLLEYSQEQECYDFIWASLDTKEPSHQIRSKDVWKDSSALIEAGLSLSHLVALTLLKLRLYLDIDDMSRDLNRPGVRHLKGAIAQEIYKLHYNHIQLSKIARDLHDEYFKLVEHVQAINPHLWEALATQNVAYTLPSATRGPGSRDEANRILHHCKIAWVQTIGALDKLEADTAKYIRVYKPSAVKIKTEPLERRKGTGKAFPVRLKQPEISRFPLRVTSHFNSWRCRMVLGSRRLLLYADAAWLGGGHAPWAVSLGCDAQLGNSVTTGRVEALCPFNHSEPITSSRAELRAVIAALRLSDWKEEGFKSITIATSSTYVFRGAGKVQRWRSNGWKRKRGKDVSDRDLWELLLGETERWKDKDVEVCVLGVPREVTVETGTAASAAARKLQDQARFTDVALDPSLEAKNQPENVTIIIALGGNDLSPNSWQSTLLPMAQERSAETPERALQLLSGPPPSGIFIADAAITRHREVLERVIDAMHKGAKVVVGGVFASTVTPLEFTRFFTILGLPWERRTNFRTDLYLRPGVLYSHSTVRLPRELMDKLYFIESVKESENWYTFTGNAAEGIAAVAYTKIGAGAFGYVGCASHERGAINVARVMLGQTL